MGFIAPPRQGKTLKLAKIGYNDWKAGRKIYNSIGLKLPNVIDLPDPDTILDFAFMELDTSDKTFLIQEADKWFDARESWKPQNRMLSKFTGQSGKREIDIYWDTQFPTRVDKGLRDITEIFVYARCIRDPSTKEPILFQYYHDNVFYPQLSYTEKILAPFMEPFYNIYDTRKLTLSERQ